MWSFEIVLLMLAIWIFTSVIAIHEGTNWNEIKYEVSFLTASICLKNGNPFFFTMKFKYLLEIKKTTKPRFQRVHIYNQTHKKGKSNILMITLQIDSTLHCDACMVMLVMLAWYREICLKKKEQIWENLRI